MQGLEVPEEFVDTPLRLTVLENNRYRVEDPDGNPLLEGALGASATAGSGPARIDVYVSHLVARPGT